MFLMSNLSEIIQLLAILPYCGIIGYCLWRWTQSQNVCQSTMISLSVVAFIVHVFALGQIITYPYGWNLQIEFSISLIAAVTILIATITQFKRQVHLIIFVISPIAIASILLAWNASDQPSKFVAYKLGWHVLLSISAFSVYAIAALLSWIIYTYQKYLKFSHPFQSPFFAQLPALESMNILLINLMIACLVLLTLAIATGSYYLTDIFQQHLSHKIFFTCLAWILVLLITVKHFLQGWKSHQLAYWIWSGFIFLALAYLGSKYMLERIIN